MLMPEFYPNPDSASPSPVLCIVGTRPEVIKMAPVIRALRHSEHWDVKVIATAQHRELLDQVLDVFGIAADSDLDAMRPDQDLAALTARLLTGLDACLEAYKPRTGARAGRHHHGSWLRRWPASTGRCPSLMWKPGFEPTISHIPGRKR